MSKKTAILILCVFMLLNCYKIVVSAFDMPGYEETNPGNVKDTALNGLTEKDGFYYYYENGEIVKSKWVLSDGKKYYFKKDGRAAVLSCKIEGKYYVFNNQGQLMQPESKKIVSIKITGGTKKYYVSPDGNAINGWTENRKYYCYENGETATGIIIIDGKFYCFSTSGKYSKQKTVKIRKVARYKKPFENLKKFIGKPNKIKYYASCYGNGKDGVLSYDNFTIYTFKPVKGKEIFMGAE